jgi:hypothetical protein
MDKELRKKYEPFIGRRVKLNPDSRFVGKAGNPCNPETTGIIMSLKVTGLPLWVLWNEEIYDGSTTYLENTYDICDLILLEHDKNRRHDVR